MKLINNRNKGFTLSEVLITLGIIGIIAALTIPNLTNKIDTYQRITRFKLMYSKLVNAWNLAVADFGYMPACGYNPLNYNVAKTNDCTEFGKAIISHLKVAKICPSNALTNGCITEDFTGADDVYRENHKDYTDEQIANLELGSAMSKALIRKSKTAVVLADGTYLILNTDYSPIIILIDINGSKGPNKWGYDIFPLQTFWSKADNQTVELRAWARPIKHIGGFTTQEMLDKIRNSKKE